MAKFAQYYLKYNLEHMFSAEYKDQRQQIFGAFFETNGSIDFVLGEGEDQKVYKHQVYHLSQNKDIIVMRIANVRKKTVEQNFVELDVKHEPSCYVIIDKRTYANHISKMISDAKELDLWDIESNVNVFLKSKKD